MQLADFFKYFFISIMVYIHLPIILIICLLNKELMAEKGIEQMTLDDVIKISIDGFSLEGCNCLKDEEGICDCIRTVFPSRSHYELFLLVRENYLSLLRMGLIAVLLQQNQVYIEGENNGQK